MELLKRHKALRAQYEVGGILANWGQLRVGDLDRAQAMADVILAEGILPYPVDLKTTPLVVSLSANTGIYETVLAHRLTGSYKVIAGDMSAIQRIPSAAESVQMDASFLPFAENSITAMVDLQGALWHEADFDLRRDDRDRVDAENMLDMFQRLRRHLVPGGVIIVDDPEFLPEAAGGTGMKIDDMVRLSRKKLEGFEVFTIGNADRRLRVFRKT